VVVISGVPSYVRGRTEYNRIFRNRKTFIYIPSQDST